MTEHESKRLRYIYIYRKKFGYIFQMLCKLLYIAAHETGTNWMVYCSKLTEKEVPQTILLSSSYNSYWLTVLGDKMYNNVFNKNKRI